MNSREQQRRLRDAQTLEGLSFITLDTTVFFKHEEIKTLPLKSEGGQRALEAIAVDPLGFLFDSSLLDIAARLRSSLLGEINQRRPQLNWLLEEIPPALLAPMLNRWQPRFDASRLNITIYGVARIYIDERGAVRAESLATKPEHNLLAVWYAEEANRACQLIEAATTLSDHLEQRKSELAERYIALDRHEEKTEEVTEAVFDLRSALWNKAKLRGDPYLSDEKTFKASVNNVRDDLETIICEMREKETVYYRATQSVINQQKKPR